MSKKRKLTVMIASSDLKSHIEAVQARGLRKPTDYSEEKLLLLLVIKQRTENGEPLLSAEIAQDIRKLTSTEHGKKISVATVQKWIEVFFYLPTKNVEVEKARIKAQVVGDTIWKQKGRLKEFLQDSRKFNRVHKSKKSTLHKNDFKILLYATKMESMTFTQLMLLYKEKYKNSGKDVNFSLSTFIRFAKKFLMGQGCTGWNMKFKLTHEKRKKSERKETKGKKTERRNKKEKLKKDEQPISKLEAFRRKYPNAVFK